MVATTKSKSRLGSKMAKELLNAGTRNDKRDLVRPIVWPGAQHQLEMWQAGTVSSQDLPAELLLAELTYFDDATLAELSADARSTVASAASDLIAARGGTANSFDAFAVLKAPRSGPHGLFELLLRRHIPMDSGIATTFVEWHRSTNAAGKPTHLAWFHNGEVRTMFTALCQAGLVTNEAASTMLHQLPAIRWMTEEILTTVTLSNTTVTSWAQTCSAGDVCNDAALLADKALASQLISACLAAGNVRHAPRSLRRGHAELTLTSAEWAEMLASHGARSLWNWASAVPSGGAVADELVEVASARFGVGLSEETGAAASFSAMVAYGALRPMLKHESKSRLCAAFQAQAVLAYDEYSLLAVAATGASIGALVGVCEAICSALSSPPAIEMALTLVRSGMPVSKAIEATVLVG